MVSRQDELAVDSCEFCGSDQDIRRRDRFRNLRSVTFAEGIEPTDVVTVAAELLTQTAGD